jgi:inactivated superfamily I helicase/CRISPR/Cas system-associated exonuclease Cas4 (RecB family)
VTSTATITIAFEQALLPALARLVYAAAPALGPCDLAQIAVVLPTRRAGRRLTELLAEFAAADRRFLTPPVLLTPGDLCDRSAAAAATARSATEIEECIAWMRAVQDCPDAVTALCGDAAGGEALLRDPFALARRLQRMHHELAGERIMFADVAARRQTNEHEHARWLALDSVCRTYHRILAAQDVLDRHAAREYALAHWIPADVALPGCAHVYVAGIVECFRQFRDMLSALPLSRTIVLHQPADADWLDADGVLRPGMPPRDTALDAHMDAVFIDDSPAAQARIVATLLAQQDQQRALTDIVISVPDPSVTRPLRDTLAAAGVPTHDAIGRPFDQTELGMLLTSLATCLDDVSVANILRLAAHPVVARWLATRLDCATQAAFDDLLRDVRDVAVERALEFATETRAGTPEPVARFFAMMQELLLALQEPRPLHTWPEQFNALLHMLYTAADSVPVWADAACHDDAIAVWCNLLREIAGSAVTLPTPLPAATALRHCLQWLAYTALAPEPSGVALDLVGWLEVACDDAPVVVLTGMNDGIVPQVLTSDAFLPDGLRRELGLQHNERRLNRDRYLLRALLAGAQQVYLLAGRFADNADPLKPSRLLCDCATASLATLLLRFYESTPAVRDATAAAPPSAPASHIAALAPPSDRDLRLPAPLTKMSVTEFAAYLGCPYQWYLRHRNIAPVPALACDIDPAALGSLLHETLAQIPLASCEPDELTARLCGVFERLLHARYGHELHPAIALQASACRAMLRGVAAQHCVRLQAGWRIDGQLERRIELTCTTAATPVRITGKVDRIDRHDNEYCVIDYKTGQTDKPRTRDGAWRDLQLALYAYHLRTHSERAATIQCAYWKVSDRAGDRALELYDLDDAAFADAWQCAGAIVARIHAHEPDAFARTDSEQPCRNCDYRFLCQRV